MARVALNLKVHGAREIAGLMDEIDAFLDEADTLPPDWDIAGLGRLFVDEEALLICGLVRSFLLAFGVICLLLALLWRSWRAALLCMIPNLTPILLIFAWMLAGQFLLLTLSRFQPTAAFVLLTAVGLLAAYLFDILLLPALLVLLSKRTGPSRRAIVIGNG